MLSYTGQRNLFGRLANNSDSDNLTLGDSLINMHTRQIINSRSWYFAQRTKTDTTVASQPFYKLPFNFKKLVSTKITSGNISYVPKECASREQWDYLTQSSAVTSNYPQWYFIYNKQIGYFPTPSTSSLTITHQYEAQYKDLSLADYTTGTITTATNSGTSIVGSGTSWTSQMAGRYILITDSNTANTGDGEWYEISSVTNATTLVLVNGYNGTSIAAGSAAYTIGQMSFLPDGYQELPIYRALVNYFTTYQDETDKAKMYKVMADELYAQMVSDFGSKSIDPVVERMDTGDVLNANLTITA